MITESKAMGVPGGRHSRTRTVAMAAGLVAMALLGGCGGLMMLFHAPMEFEAGAKPTDPAEYGFGPRLTRAGTYRVSAEPLPEIRVGRMHGLMVRVETSDGRPVENATLLVDGGMPEHNHGLPTRPEMTGSLGDGAYEVGGMKYNMGGWWVVRVRIDSPMGPDEVLFNLNL